MKFDRYAKGYDAGWQGTKSARFYDDLIKELDIQPNDAVLDVGCGTGTWDAAPEPFFTLLLPIPPSVVSVWM